MKKTPKTLLDRAAEIGVSVPTLNNWKRGGCDIFNDDEVRDRITRMRNLPPNLKPAFMPGFNQATGKPMTLEELKERLSRCTNKHEAQTIKVQIDGLRAIHQLEVEQGEWVRSDDAKADGYRAGMLVKQTLFKGIDELTPRLAGRESSDVAEELERWVRATLEHILDYKTLLTFDPEQTK